jgi:hypothetical protein
MVVKRISGKKKPKAALVKRSPSESFIDLTICPSCSFAGNPVEFLVADKVSDVCPHCGFSRGDGESITSDID